MTSKIKNNCHGIVHQGFRGFRGLVARKKGRRILIGNRLVIPYDTIPSNVAHLSRHPAVILTVNLIRVKLFPNTY